MADTPLPAPTPASPPESQPPAPPVPPVMKVVAFLIAAVIGGILLSVFKPQGFFESLRDPSYARGVITFIVALGAVTLGFIVVLFAFFGAIGDSSEERFRRAREIFVTMMGVLGTIVGYYFGQQTAPADLLGVPAIKVQTNEGQSRAMVFANGGVPPYSYTVDFEGEGNDLANVISADGWIEFEIPKPAKAPKPGEEAKPKFSIEIRDSNGRSISATHSP